jgi:hypothetical protein
MLHFPAELGLDTRRRGQASLHHDDTSVAMGRMRPTIIIYVTRISANVRLKSVMSWMAGLSVTARPLISVRVHDLPTLLSGGGTGAPHLKYENVKNMWSFTSTHVSLCNDV